MYGPFKRQTKSLAWLRKRNLQRENESLLIAAENNTIRTNYVNVRIGKTQQRRNNQSQKKRMR